MSRRIPIFKVLFSGLLVLVTVLAVAACGRIMGRTEQELVQQGKELQAQGKLASAAIEFRNALQKNPKNAEARQRLGEIYVSQGLGEQAENELSRAKELGVAFDSLKVPMGEALLLQGRYQRVLTEIQPGSKSNPSDVPKILELRGRAQLGLFRFEEGCKLFGEALESDAHYVPAYWGLARCAAAQGKLDEARTDLDKALKLEEKNSGTWALLGDLERAAQRVPEAEAAYANALSYRSNNLDALLGRAALRIDNNKIAEASQDVAVALKEASNSPIARQLQGVIQFREGQFSAAERSFQGVLKLRPNYLPAMLWLGLTNLAQGQYQQAVNQLALYTRNAPNPRVEALLAMAQAKLGSRQEAEQTLRALGKADIKDPQSLVVLAQAHISLGETDIAAAYLSKAVEEKPAAADLRVSLATALAEKGDREQAIEQLENAIQLDPGKVEADVLLIRNLIQEKQYDKALEAVAALEKKQPKNPTTFNLKGYAYLGKNDIVDARKSFEQALALEKGSVAAAMNLAQLDLLENKPEAARERFRAILAKDEKNVQAMMGMAGIAAATGQETEYVTWLEKAAQAGPSAVRPGVLLTNYYLKKGDPHKALAIAQQTQAANPANLEALNSLATAQFAAGEKESAVLSYTKLAQLVPNSPVVHYRLATALIAVGKTPEARTSLTRALELKPDYFDAEVLLASVELGAGNYAEASKIAQQLRKQYPKAAAGLALEGDVLMSRKRPGEAQAVYEKALNLEGSALLAVKLHQAISASGRTDEADARLLEWLKDHPTDGGSVAARSYLASTYIRAGQNKKAIEQYELVLRMDPKNVRALNDLAWLYQQEADPRALATAEQAYQLDPGNAEVLDTFGWIQVEQGNAAAGQKLLQEAARKAPDSAEIRYHWAVALARSGDKARARIELRDLLTKNENFPHRREAQALLQGL